MHRIRQTIAPVFRSLIDLIYPPSCVVCSQYEVANACRFLCEKCLHDLTQARMPEPQRGERRSDRDDEPKTYDFDLSSWYYDGCIESIVPAIKYHNKPTLGVFAAEHAASRLNHVVAEFIDQTARGETVLVPVPLHPRRLRERGFNQSLVIAKFLSYAWGIPLDVKALQRIRYTRSQANLSAAERMSNVANAFAPAKRTALTGKTVLLVDDVITTGSTANTCARILKDQGAAKVGVVTLARTVRE